MDSNVLTAEQVAIFHSLTSCGKRATERQTDGRTDKHWVEVGSSNNRYVSYCRYVGFFFFFFLTKYPTLHLQLEHGCLKLLKFLWHDFSIATTLLSFYDVFFLFLVMSFLLMTAGCLVEVTTITEAAWVSSCSSNSLDFFNLDCKLLLKLDLNVDGPTKSSKP